ncbi:glycosyltransferase family 2 protein [Sinomonas halotolerans]|uniref:Glycosyltransferase family 2 protein n=1 Tax=Sinomonas halotolerans TaxID=1644133 RepID=A0ABU9WYM2_9MICC
MKRISKISVIILTKNEEAGIQTTLNRVNRFDDVIVVDSNSEDRTRAIAAQHGAEITEFTWNKRYPKKKQWSLENAPIRNRWVLLLDADEYPSPGMLEELAALQESAELDRYGAFDISLLYKFGGRFLRHGHTVTKRSLVHADRANFPEVDDLMAPGIREVEGHYQPETGWKIGRLKSRLFHDDKDPVSSWFDRHNRYSDWEAYLRLHKALGQTIDGKRSARGRIFAKIPLKPAAFFLYSYLLRAGFLDGRAGFDYAIALSTYYWQIGVKTREMARVSR